jgi:hypothetical protein
VEAGKPRLSIEIKVGGMARGKPIYRFAIYGRAGSGKTCLLATLAAVGASTVRGNRRLTCQYLPPEAPHPNIPTIDIGSHNNGPPFIHRIRTGLHYIVTTFKKIVYYLRQGQHPDEVLHEREGHASIKNAAEALLSGRVPQATPPTVRLVCRYKINDPVRGSWNVVLTDYSGELINPNIISDPASFARRLRDYLVQSDGFMILAETPSNSSHDDSYLTLLRSAFASIREQKKDDLLLVPVCILFTKWDRRSNINQQEPQAELDKLKSWLDEFLPHQPALKSLVDDVGHITRQQKQFADTCRLTTSLPVNSSSAPSAIESSSASSDIESWAVKYDDAVLFPVSAFGGSKKIANAEVPASRPAPFGILEPFVWLADRRDQLELLNLMTLWTSRRWLFWVFAFWLDFTMASQMLMGAIKLHKRVPRFSPHRNSVRRLVQRISAAAIICTSIWVLCLGFLGICTYSAGKRLQFSWYQHIARSQDSSIEQLRQAREFFRKWHTGWNGILVPTRQSAEKELNDINTRMEETLYQGATLGDLNCQKRQEEAQKYLDEFPLHYRAAEVKRILDKAKEECELAQVNKKVQIFDDKIKKAETLEELDKIQSDLFSWQDTLSNPKHIHLAQTVSVNLALRRAELSQSRLEQEFWTAVRANDWSACSNILTNYSANDDAWRNCVTEFCKYIPGMLNTKIGKKIEDGHFVDAREYYNSAYKSARSLESLVNRKAPYLQREVLEAIQKLNAVTQHIDEQEDRFLYRRVLDHRTKEDCEEYLQKAPLKSMMKQVQAYHDYLDTLDKKLRLVCEIKIRWDPYYNDGDGFEPGENVISVFWNDERIFTSGQIAEIPGELSGPIGTWVLTGTKRTSGILRVSIVEIDSGLAGANDDGGSGERKCTLEDLATSRIEIPLRSRTNSKIENRALITVIERWPQEPELPPWQGK